MRRVRPVGADRASAFAGLVRALWTGTRRMSMGTSRMRGSRDDGLPVYTYDTVPGVPPVSAIRLGQEGSPGGLPPGAHSHSHDFLVLTFHLEWDGGSLRLGDREWQIEAGDVYLIAPGEIVDPSGLEESEGWAVFFPPEALGSQAPGTFLSWRAHPLLFPFVRGAAGGAQRLKVPPEDRPSWSERLSALDLELRQRHDGYREAVLSHLTLLLVGVSRLAANVVGDLRLNDEPLLAEVFDFIEKRYSERVSLRDVARAVSLSRGHLTTVVRRKTGRTVQEWIAERRMAEARRLLVETDLAVEEVGRRVGYGDPGYFVRSFRSTHGATPLGWRRAGRP
jgi:AraC family transcriptional regulator, transcriptional activator of pobA